jgi:hypothetical protein
LTNILTHPLDALVEWFQSFSEADRAEIAYLTLYTPCDFKTSDQRISRLQAGDILGMLRELYKKDPRHTISEMVSFMAAVDFFVWHERGTEYGWNEILKLSENVKSDLLQRGHSLEYVAPLSRAVMEMPLKKKRWLKQSNSWQLLRLSSLSNTSLMNWLYHFERHIGLVPIR